MKKSFQIADCIVAFIKGEITQEELAWLDAWLEENPENKELFVSLMDETVFYREKQALDPIKLQTAFQAVKTGKDKLRRKRRWRRISVAAACLALIFSVYMLMIPHIGHETLIAEKNIEPIGSQQAYLILASGEKVTLSRNKADTIRMDGLPQQIISDRGSVQVENLSGDSIPAEMYHTMEVPQGCDYNLTLSDGTCIWLNAGSRLKFPVRFNGSQRYVELAGEAYFAVNHDEDRPFIVHTDNLDVQVLGTEFCIRDYAGKPALATLVKGKVQVSDAGWETILKPGQQAVIFEGNASVHEVETIFYTAWKDGYFIFNDTPLCDIMEELSSWYDFKCFFSDRNAADLKISARMKKYDSFDVLLNILDKMNEVQIEKKGNTIVIGSK